MGFAAGEKDLVCQNAQKLKGHSCVFNLASEKAGCYNGPKGGMSMKDFPVFSTDSGVSSLILKEIPYRKEAYIHIRDVQETGFEEHLKECISFCRMAGAEKIYAQGHPLLAQYPLYTDLVEMRGTAWVNPDKLEHLFPVTDRTVGEFRRICNMRMKEVANASTLTLADEQTIVQSGGAYFVHHAGQLLGVGWLEDTKLLLVAAVKPGAGERVMHTLMSAVEGADMVLEVASANERAIRLYEKLGFLKVRNLVSWHQVV